MITADHLRKEERINLGSYYTSQDIVRIVWDWIKPLIDSKTVIFDPACGYGSFLKEKTIARKVGNDIDKKAIEIASSKIKDVQFFNYNALTVLKRETYSIGKQDKLVIIGNPPYNDITSHAKKKVKKLPFKVDDRLKARDIGISFLRLFYYLKADYVCVLHPLSFLIKRANFNLLKGFKENYRLVKTLIFSSKVFPETSKNSEFPIIVALYKRDLRGMGFSYIENYTFKTIEGRSFKLSDFDYIGNYIQKYPSKSNKPKEGDLMFYTLRDINALKRNRTFIFKPTANAVKIEINNLDYYVYIDVFKEFIKHVPYYFGNLDVIIDRKIFEEYKQFFISYSIRKNKFLRKFYNHKPIHGDKDKIIEYFKKLLGEHFNENS